jgi:hypothetical protein
MPKVEKNASNTFELYFIAQSVINISYLHKNLHCRPCGTSQKKSRFPFLLILMRDCEIAFVMAVRCFPRSFKCSLLIVRFTPNCLCLCLRLCLKFPAFMLPLAPL